MAAVFTDAALLAAADVVEVAGCFPATGFVAAGFSFGCSLPASTFFGEGAEDFAGDFVLAGVEIPDSAGTGFSGCSVGAVEGVEAFWSVILSMLDLSVTAAEPDWNTSLPAPVAGLRGDSGIGSLTKSFRGVLKVSSAVAVVETDAVSISALGGLRDGLGSKLGSLRSPITPSFSMATKLDRTLESGRGEFAPLKRGKNELAMI